MWFDKGFFIVNEQELRWYHFAFPTSWSLDLNNKAGSLIRQP